MTEPVILPEIAPATVLMRTIVLCDICDSMALKLTRGDAAAAALIADRLRKLEAAFKAVDPTVTRTSASEGDSLFLTGSRALDLFHAAVVAQGIWRVWDWSTGVPSVRIGIGEGEFATRPDGEWVGLSGIAIDLTGRVRALCPEAGVAVTESVRSRVQAGGFAYKLNRVEAPMKGFAEPQSFYLADGVWKPGDAAKGENLAAVLPMVLPVLVPPLPTVPPLSAIVPLALDPRTESGTIAKPRDYRTPLSIAALVAAGLAVLATWWAG